MKLLLDTMVFVASMSSVERLSARAYEAIRSQENDVYFSVASAWEMAIKAGIGKLAVPANLQGAIEERLRRSNIALLPISLQHVVGVRDLPLHHRDPFDRMLVAQAQIEGLALVTNDPFIAHYDVEQVW